MTRVRRVPVVDALHHPAESLYLTEHRAVRIGGVGPVLLDLCQDWVDVPTLIGRLEDIVGAAPTREDAEAFVDEAIRALRLEGLVEVDPTPVAP